MNKYTGSKNNNYIFNRLIILLVLSVLLLLVSLFYRQNYANTNKKIDDDIAFQSSNIRSIAIDSKLSDEEHLIIPSPGLEHCFPFSNKEGRYRELFLLLLNNGVKESRIAEIFSSDRAKKIDEYPISRLSNKVIGKTKLRPQQEINKICSMINSHLNEYRKYYDQLEAKYNVNREIVAAILYKETSLGNFSDWQHESFTVLNSIIGFLEAPQNASPIDRKRIDRIVKTAILSLNGLIFYCEKYDIDILSKTFSSSFAGAIGIPQFMPMYMNFAISTDGTIPDLSKMSDAILSIGNIFIQKFDWPGYMDLYKLDDINGIVNKYKDYDENKGVSFCASEHLDGYPLRRFIDEYNEIPNIKYIGKYGRSIMNYNFSSAYALDILQLAYYTFKNK